MTENRSEMDYDRLVEDALKSVLRTALHITAENGLPGEHYFYITFASRHPDVALPDPLLKTHPEEMTIVLQHQFWDLNVEEDAFSVTLSFNDQRQRIRVPFNAVSSFADPHAKFGLQFSVDEDIPPPDQPEAKDSLSPEAAENVEAENDAAEDDNVITLDTFRRRK